MAEIEESKKADFKEIQNVFESLLQRLEEDYKQSNEKYDREAKALMAHLQESTRQEDDQQEDEWDGERREAERELLKEHEKEVHLRIEVVREAKNAEFKISTSLTWIILMRFARRSQNIKAARQIFSRARKSPLITSHVYTASALMEFYVNKDAVVAGKIFELGMKTFNIAQDPFGETLISRYLDFLLCLNDDNSLQILT